MSTPNFVGFWMRVGASSSDPVITIRTFLFASQNIGVEWVMNQKN